VHRHLLTSHLNCNLKIIEDCNDLKNRTSINRNAVGFYGQIILIVNFLAHSKSNLIALSQSTYTVKKQRGEASFSQILDFVPELKTALFTFFRAG
jgi:hypothetical protein